MGIEPTRQLFTVAPDLKSGSPTSELSTSGGNNNGRSRPCQWDSERIHHRGTEDTEKKFCFSGDSEKQNDCLIKTPYGEHHGIVHLVVRGLIIAP